ncbi:MAG: sugar porter family MFS transporter [Pirellulales bacterium]|nr:sugar porter family MFS transporter [Pirellulales bacterium]
MNIHLLSATIIAALGGFLFGFDTAVISGTTDLLEQVFGLDQPWLGLPGSFWLGLTVAIALIGTVIGSVLVGKPADHFGRRSTLVVMAIFYFVSAVGCAWAWDWWSLLAFRFLGGLAVGGASVVSPMYIAEISPARVRGRLVAVQQFNIVTGILVAFFSNYIIQQMDFGLDAWRWMFGVEAIPAAAFFGLLFVTPRSPRWLITQGDVLEASRVLEKLGTDNNDIATEIRDIQESLDLEHHSLQEPFFQKKYQTPILLATAIAMFNQLSGINALMYYGPHIFRMAGATEGSDLLQTVAIGGTNLLFTICALAVIDHFGRKKLMFVGSIGYILSLGVCAWAFYTYQAEFRASINAADQVDKAKERAEQFPDDLEARQALSDARTAADTASQNAFVGGTIVLVSLLVFIASHAFGQGAVIWVFISEIFPNRIRARGQALGSFTHWIMASAISWTFPMIAEVSGGHAFAFYSVMMIGQCLWVLAIMPETKGVPLEQIQKQFGIE